MCTQFGNHSLLVLSLSLLHKLLNPCRQGLYHFTTEALLILHQYRQPGPSLSRATQVMRILNHQQPIKGLLIFISPLKSLIPLNPLRQLALLDLTTLVTQATHFTQAK